MRYCIQFCDVVAIQNQLLHQSFNRHKLQLVVALGAVSYSFLRAQVFGRKFLSGNVRFVIAGISSPCLLGVPGGRVGLSEKGSTRGHFPAHSTSGPLPPLFTFVTNHFHSQTFMAAAR